jgi:uncharacterized protein YprB with RNaseH-like and TPR domain
MDARDRLRRELQDAGVTVRPRAFSPPTLQPSLTTSPATEPGIEHFLPGFWQDTPAGRVFVVEQRFDLDHRHGAYPLGSTLDVPADLLARIGRSEALADVSHERILYLDTETTGLAGGTGTLAFLVGIGHFQDGAFRLRQYFLDSLDREEALLRALSDYLDPFEAVVTYNGKAFDLPLLETRLIMSRLRRDVRALPHLDLLFATRRIYRDRFGSCRLMEIERQVLGLERPNDVPGFEVPALYFRFVRYRRFRALVPVFKHNAMDVLSLVTLVAHLGGLYRNSQPQLTADELALARSCEQDGHAEEALTRYRSALARGLPPVPRDEAERRLSLLYKRLGRWADAVAIWDAIVRRPENRSVFPHLELAMYSERQERDYASALEHTQNALELLRRHHIRLGAAGAADQELALERRLTRLQSRIERRPAAKTRTGALPAGEE